MTAPERRLRGALSLLTLTRLVLNSAHRLVYPFLPVIARGLGVSLDQAGLLVSARWAAGLATPLVAATAGRGEQRRRQILAGIALFVVGAGVTAGFGIYAGAIVGFALMGLAKPSFDVAAQAYLADRVPYARRARVLGIFEMMWAGGLLIGAPAAGWMIDRAGWAAPFWALATLGVVAAAVALKVLERDAGEQRTKPAPVEWDRASIALLAVMSLFGGGAEVLFVVFGAWLEDSFGLSIVALGGTAVLIGLAELAGEGVTVMITDRIGKRRALIIGLVVAALGYLLLIPGENSFIFGLSALAIGLAGFEFAILSSVPLQTEIRPHARVRFLSWTVVAMGVARAVGAAVGPPMFGEFGLAGNAIAAAAANVLAVAIIIVWVDEPAGGPARKVGVSTNEAGTKEGG